MNTLDLLKDDFKLFLQALWAELDLPSPTRAQYAIADYLQHGPKRLGLNSIFHPQPVHNMRLRTTYNTVPNVYRYRHSVV
jgi:hypothetical protein